ncbi:transforming growth factor beta receptor type 3-like [Cyprinus carpio]|uniref:Transforming growth factor beta receptor type 3-like n=1 Tax=Cyprinus carpio TaxID=7962 RepID=A0A9Q9Y0Z4_CYPCA|nr:transforming growth factor beta receptor type 3-like [Cyprinus carpio]
MFQSQLLSLPDLGIMDQGMFPPELSILFNTNPLPKPSARDPSARNRFPFPFLPSAGQGLSFPPLTPSMEEHDHQAGGPEEQQGASNVGFNVQCEKNKMVVSINKETLQANGFGKPNITLQDSQCKATSNNTHYILETPLSGCPNHQNSLPAQPQWSFISIQFEY